MTRPPIASTRQSAQPATSQSQVIRVLSPRARCEREGC
jgi:hypothetical protein